MTMGDRIAVMNEGRLEQIGTPDEIYNRPATVFAVEHLGRESVVILEDGDRNKLHALVEPGFAGRVGDRLHAAPDPTHCLLFDQAGSALSHPEPE